jgi:hypothetical protein
MVTRRNNNRPSNRVNSTLRYEKGKWLCIIHVPGDLLYPAVFVTRTFPSGGIEAVRTQTYWWAVRFSGTRVKGNKTGY